MFQIKMRVECVECKGKDPNCLLCDGTGRVEFWCNLDDLIKAIKSDEPELEIVLSRVGENLSLYQRKVEERAKRATTDHPAPPEAAREPGQEDPELAARLDDQLDAFFDGDG